MCTSLEFNELFGSSFDVPCFVFSSFVVQFSRYRSLPLFATAYLVYHTQFRLSRGFLNFFSSFFSTFSSAQSHNLLLLLAHSLSPLPLGHRLPCGALLYYHFLPLLSTPFLSFFRLFSSFLPFLFDVSSFLSLFSRFFGVLWVFVGRDGCGAMIRGLLTSELPAQETGLFFSLVRKEPKVHQRSADLWTPGTVQNSMEKYFSWHFLHSSLNRYMVRRAFSDVLNRCERVIVVQTQD